MNNLNYSGKFHPMTSEQISPTFIGTSSSHPPFDGIDNCRKKINLRWPNELWHVHAIEARVPLHLSADI